MNPSDVEKLAARLLRQISILGHEPYEAWLVSEKMVEMSLNYRDHEKIFLPNQPRLKRVDRQA
jgi:hypothetical protein